MLEKTMLKRHYELWDWLSKNPEKHKNHFPKWKQNGGKWKHIKQYCFLCKLHNGDCNKCQLGYCGQSSRFWYWQHAELEQRRKYAEEIRDIIKVKN